MSSRSPEPRGTTKQGCDQDLFSQDRDQDQDLSWQDRDQDQDLSRQDRDQDQDLSWQDRDQDQDLSWQDRDQDQDLSWHDRNQDIRIIFVSRYYAVLCQIAFSLHILNRVNLNNNCMYLHVYIESIAKLTKIYR